MNARWLKFLPGFIGDRLAGRHRLQAILGNSGWLFADKILRIGVGIFVSVWVARYLGPERFGELSFAVAFVALFAALATLGLDSIAVREFVRNPDQKHEILGSVFTLKLIGGSVAFVLAIAAITVMRPADSQVQWLIGIVAAGMIFQAFDAVDLWFQSQVQSKYTVIVRSSAFVVVAAVKVWLILINADVVAFAWTAAAEVAMSGIGLFFAFRLTNCKWLSVNASRPLMASLLKDSWPLILSGLAVVIYMRIDQVMLAEMISSREVGLYSAALKLSEAWYVIPTVLVGSAMPYLTEAREKSEELYFQRLQQLFTVLARVSYLVAIPMVFLARPLILFLYGDSYSAASEILVIHIWTAVFVFQGVGMGVWIVNERFTQFSLYQTMLGAVSNICLNFLLIPMYGAIGAAMATLVAQFIAAYLALAFLKKTRKFFVMENRALFKFM